MATGRQAAVEINISLAEDPDNLQLLFIKGMMLDQLGRRQQAAKAFRRILAIDPTLPRPRLELARVLAEDKDYQAARYHFEQVLAQPLPDPVKANIRAYLNRIRERLPSYNLTLELVSDSNPKQATDDEDVIIDGVRYRLNDDARAEQATGWRVAGDVRIPLGDNALWFVSGHLDHHDYPGTDYDFTYAQGGIGRHLPLSLGNRRQTFTWQVGYQGAQYQGEALYNGILLSVRDYIPLTDRLALQLDLAGLQLNYDDYDYLSGWQYKAHARLHYASRADRRWLLELGYDHMDAREDAYAFDQPRLKLRYTHEWTGGWITGTSAELSGKHYQAPDPFFQETRKERLVRLEADLLNRQFNLWRLSPRLVVGWEDNDSNLDLYTWDRVYVRVGMTGEF